MRLILAAAMAVGLMIGGAAHDDEPQPQCTEDMTCWDCETMGNLRCGPLLDI